MYICIAAVLLHIASPERLHLIKGDSRGPLLKELNRDQAFDEVASSLGGKAFQVWSGKTCSDVVRLFSVTSRAISSIQDEIKMKSGSKDRVVQLKLHALSMLSEELVESERWIFSALHMLKETVKSSAANSLDRTVANAKGRLEELQYATLLEEQKFDKLGIILGQIKELHAQSGLEHNFLYDFIKDVLTDVESAADMLDDNLRDQIGPFQPRDIETVKKLTDGELSVSLEDIHGNIYVISQPADKTDTLIDHALLKSILLLLAAAGFLSWFCLMMNIPTIFGHILTGMVLGPSCVSLIQDPVQVEAMGEIGVFLILFSCGLEFSPASFIKVWRVAVCGSLSIVFLISLLFTLCGTVLQISLLQSVFVALCLSFSSTALIIKFLRDEPGEDVTQLRDTMLGMVVFQDIQVSLIMGFLPLLAGTSQHHSTTHVDNNDQGYQGTTLFVLVFSLAGLGVLARLGRRFISPLIKIVAKPLDAEVSLLLPLGGCFGLCLLLSRVGVSMEVACFLAGVILKSLSRGEQTLRIIEPVCSIFEVLFFSSVGLHIYPSFVWSQIYLILSLTLFVVTIKYLVGLLALQPLTSDLQRSVISAGLAQISEFSFVLANRGRKLHLLNREVYLLIVSITAASLVLSPLVWKMSLLQLRRGNSKVVIADGHQS